MRKFSLLVMLSMALLFTACKKATIDTTPVKETRGSRAIANKTRTFMGAEAVALSGRYFDLWLGAEASYLVTSTDILKYKYSDYIGTCSNNEMCEDVLNRIMDDNVYDESYYSHQWLTTTVDGNTLVVQYRTVIKGHGNGDR